MANSLICEGSATVLSDYHICRYDPILGLVVAVGDDCDVVVFGRNLCRRRIPVRRGVHWLDCFLYAGTSSFLLLSSEVLDCVNYQTSLTTNSLFANDLGGEGVHSVHSFSYLTCLHIPQGLTCGAVGRRSGIVSYFRFCDTKNQGQELFWTVKETNVLQLVAPFPSNEDLSDDTVTRCSPQFKALLRGLIHSNNERKAGETFSLLQGSTEHPSDVKNEDEEEVFFPLGSVISLDSFPENPNSLIGVVAGVPGVLEWTIEKGKAVSFFSAGSSPSLSLKENIIVTCKVTPGGHYVVATTSDSSQVFVWKARGHKKKSNDVRVEVYWVVDLSGSIGHDLLQNTVEAFQFNEYRIGMYMARASPRKSNYRNRETGKEEALISSTSSLASPTVLTDKHSQLFLLINGQRDILEVVLLVEEKMIVDQEQVINDLNVYTARKGGAASGSRGRGSSVSDSSLHSSHWDPSVQGSPCSSGPLEKQQRSSSRGNPAEGSAVAANFFKVFHVEPCSPRCYWNSELTDTDLDSMIITSSGGLQPMVVKRKQFEQGLQSIQELREIPGDAPWYFNPLLLHLPHSEQEATLRKLAGLMTSSIYVNATQSSTNSFAPSSTNNQMTSTSSPCSTMDELVFGGGNLLELYFPLGNKGQKGPVISDDGAEGTHGDPAERESSSILSSSTVVNTGGLSLPEKQRWQQLVAEEVTFATVLGWGSAVLLSPCTSQILRVDPSALQQCPLWNIMADKNSVIVFEVALPPSSSGLPAEVILRVTAYDDQVLVTKYHIRQRVGRTALVLDKKNFRMPPSCTVSDNGFSKEENSFFLGGSGAGDRILMGDEKRGNEGMAFPRMPKILFTTLVETRIWLPHLHPTFRSRTDEGNLLSMSSETAFRSKSYDNPVSLPEFYPDGKCLLLVLEDASFLLVDISGEAATGPHKFCLTSSGNGVAWKVMCDKDTGNSDNEPSGPIQLLFPASEFLKGLSWTVKVRAAEAFWGSTPTFSSEALHLVALLEDTQTADQLLLVWNFKTMKRRFYSLCSSSSTIVRNLGQTSTARSPSLKSNVDMMEDIQRDQKEVLSSSSNAIGKGAEKETDRMLSCSLHLAGSLATNSPNMTGDVVMFTVDLSVTHPPSGPGSECGEVTLSDAAGGTLYRIQMGFGMSKEGSHEWCMRVTPLNDFVNAKHYRHLSQWNSLGFPLNIKRIRVSGTLEISEDRENNDNSCTATTMFWRCVCEEDETMREGLYNSSIPQSTNTKGCGETYDVLLRGAISYCQTSWPFGNVILYTQTKDQHMPKRHALLNPQRNSSAVRFTKLPPCAPLLVVVQLRQVISIDIVALLRGEGETLNRPYDVENGTDGSPLAPISLEVEKMKGTVRSIQLANSSILQRWIDNVVFSSALHAILIVTRDANGWRWIHVVDECTLSSRMQPYPTLDFAGEERIKVLLMKEDSERNMKILEKDTTSLGGTREGRLQGSSPYANLRSPNFNPSNSSIPLDSTVISQLYIVGTSTGIIGHYRIIHRPSGGDDSFSSERATLSVSSGGDSCHMISKTDNRLMSFPYLPDPFWPSHYKPLPSSFRRYRFFLPRRPTQKAESNFFKRLMSAPWEDIAEQLVNNAFVQVRRGNEMSTKGKSAKPSTDESAASHSINRHDESVDPPAMVAPTPPTISPNSSALNPPSARTSPSFLSSMGSHISRTLPSISQSSGESLLTQRNGGTRTEASSTNKLSPGDFFAAKEKIDASNEARGYRYMQLKSVAQRENVTLQEARRMMGENVRKLQERGERLSAVSNKSAQLANQALTFQDLARQLKEKQKNSWL